MSQEQSREILTVGLAQISPVWLNRQRTLSKIIDYVQEAADKGCDLVVFGEALLPGYPFWIERSDGARFNSPVQKELYALYLDNAVQIEAGHLEPLTKTILERHVAVMLGIIERPADRGGHSVYASLVYIDALGTIQSVHRKLMPTYEERLSWGIGDGHGLRTHRLGAFTIGGLNCWENWLPLARAALYGQGEDLHVAVWPGNDRNTQDVTRFIAQESRSYVLSVSGLMTATDIPEDIPYRSKIMFDADEVFANGGSCIAGPDGQWLVAPVINTEQLITAKLDHKRVREERLTLDPAGHYARPDVLQLSVNRQRQGTIHLNDE